MFDDRLCFELAFHGRAVDKLFNRGLFSLAERLEVPVVATNAVRYGRPEDALTIMLLTSIRRGARRDAFLGSLARLINRRLRLSITLPRRHT